MPAKKSTIPATRGPGSDDPFVWDCKGGGTLTVPSMSKLFKTAGELRRMRNKSPIDVAMFVIERDCTPKELEQFDEMSMEEFEAFSVAWGSHSGVDAGESPAS